MAESDKTYEKNYIVDEERIASVGEPLLSVTTDIVIDPNTVMVNSYTPLEDFSISLPNGSLIFKRGRKYYSIYKSNNVNLIQNRLKKWVLYVPVNNEGIIVGNEAYYLKRDIQKHPFGIFSNYRKSVRKHKSFIFDNKQKLYPKFKYLGRTREQASVGKGNGIIRELIYSGKFINSIKILYREYTSNHIIRSAFTQEVTYDLNESSVVKFRNIRIEILKATNENLLYKVISSGEPFK